MKPLFIPLCSRYYDLFVSGDKSHELRRYGPRWNEKVCAIGRPVTLSRGYGTKDRMSGVIVSFAKVHPNNIGGLNRIALNTLYGNLDFEVADIGIAIHCEDCGEPATHITRDGVPLCDGDWVELGRMGNTAEDGK
jgi:hypothetical protein